MLKLLDAVAPAPDSVDTFIPQQRAVFLMRQLNGWLVSEEDLDDDISEEVETRIFKLYSNLCPIVQDVQGAHWDSIFDMLASNLEVTFGFAFHAV